MDSTASGYRSCFVAYDYFLLEGGRAKRVFPSDPRPTSGFMLPLGPKENRRRQIHCLGGKREERGNGH